MICTAWIRGAEVGFIFLLFQCSDLVVSAWHQPPSCHVVPHKQSMCRCWLSWDKSSLGLFLHEEVGLQNYCEEPCRDWASSTLRTSFRVQCCGCSASPGSVWASFPSDKKALGGQVFFILPFPSITHQPPPLFLSLPPLCPALLESKALYGEFITTAAIDQP